MKRFLESNWSQIVPQLKRKYRLSDSDLEFPDGEERRLLRRLERLLDKNRDELIREMKELITN